jgi:hypothetical protein
MASITKKAKEYIVTQQKIRLENVYSRLEINVSEILSSLTNIFDDEDEKRSFYKNINNAIRKLKVLRKIVKRRGFDKKFKDDEYTGKGQETDVTNYYERLKERDEEYNLGIK